MPTHFEREELSKVRKMLLLARLDLMLLRADRLLKYSPDQPRAPAGSPEGGRWTSGGGGGAIVGGASRSSLAGDGGGDGLDRPRTTAERLAAAADYAVRHLFPSSRGYCAKHVRRALAAGGTIIKPPPVRPEGSEPWALDYGPSLEAAGFRAVERRREPGGAIETTGEDTVPKIGDVVVTIRGKGVSKYGHIAIYTSEGWVSDYRQFGNPFPSKDARDARPAYVLYRLP